MKNLQTFLLILTFLIFGCSKNRKNELNGVWYNVDSSDRNYYYEAHITDTGFVVINQSGLNYISSYELKTDTLIQYIRDPFSNQKLIDTLKFKIERNQKIFKMRNLTNTKSYSKWTKIPNIKPFEFYNNQSVDTFALKLKKRYFENYVSKFVPKNYINHTMNYFDIDWKLNKE